MPYHVFEINAFKQFEHKASYDTYRLAKDAVSTLRKENSSPGTLSYRMMHASTPEHALQLLKEKREPRPMGEHD